MKYTQLGMSDLHISELALGSVAANTEATPGDREFREAVAQAIDSGINLFDTAEGYGAGRAETVLGSALKGVRDKVYIISKVSRTNLKHDDVIKACEGSLRRLDTDYIDLYFIHIPNPEVPIEETMEALLTLRQSGKIKAIGVSNFTREQMEQAWKVGRFDALQPCYNLLWRNIERDAVPFCLAHNIGIIPYSPLVQGILAGAYDQNTDFESLGDRKRILLFRDEWFGQCLDVVDAMRPIAEAHGKTLAQVAINWINCQPAIASVLTGGKDAAQVIDNIGATGWTLTEAELKTLDTASRTVTDHLPDQVSFWFKY